MERKIYKLLSGAKQGLFALALTVFSAAAYAQTTYTFNYTGGQQTIPLQAGSYTIETWGANGGDNLGNGSTTFLQNGGKGGYSKGTYTLASAATLYVNVGGRGVNSTTVLSTTVAGGYNGGGYGSLNTTSGKTSGAGGGGATHLATLTGSLGALSANQPAVLIVAGGGGGAGESDYASNNAQYNSNGGNGGGLSGLQDAASGYQGRMGQGGTQTAGGTGGDNISALAGVPLQGIFGVGGYNPIAGANTSAGGSGIGGGGGGWYGGGAGWGGLATAFMAGSGGGGSGYIGGVNNGITVAFGQTGYLPDPDVTGNGWVVITQLCNINITNASTTGPGPICTGNSATLTSNGISNYLWSNGATTASIIVTPTVTTGYTLSATSILNCTATSVITVSVDTSTPVVTASSSSSSVCAGKTVILTGGGAASYTWTGGATNAAPYVPSSTGGYTVTGSNACGTGTAAVNVTVNPSPTVLAGSSSPTVCNGSAVTFTSGGNATSYVWSNGIVNNTPFIPNTTADYTLTGSASGCTTQAVVSVTVLITPTITPVVTPTAICFGATATLSAVGATSYSWSPGTNLITSTVAVSPPLPTTYTLYRSNGVCSSTSTVNLVVNALPSINATASPSQICAGTGVNLSVIGAITCTWLPGNFQFSNFNVFPNFTTNYTVTGSNANCTATAVVPVIVNPTPIVSINTSTNTICEGQSVSMSAGGTGLLTYTWQPMNTFNASATTSPPTTTIVTLSASNSFGCVGSTNQLITVNSAPNMSLTSSLPYICAGDQSILSVANITPNVVYSWTGGPVSPTYPVSPVVTTTYTATGTNSVTGCTNTNTIVLAVYISTFTVNSPTAICVGQSATLSVTGSATSYTWNTANGVNTPSVVVSPVLTTIYTATGSNGSCENGQTFTVVVHPLPNVQANVAKSTICKYEVATISASGANTYSWSTTDTGSTLTFTLAVTTTYTVTGTDNFNCAKTATATQYVATCAGIENVAAGTVNNLNVYPNPNNGSFIVSSDLKTNLQLVDALGQLITTIQLGENETREVTVNNLPAGIYFISGKVGDLKINKKIVIER